MLALAYNTAVDFFDDLAYNGLTVVKSGNTFKAYCANTNKRIGKFNTKTKKGFINYNTEFYDTPFTYTLRVK
jgi:hypothetical protein